MSGCVGGEVEFSHSQEQRNPKKTPRRGSSSSEEPVQAKGGRKDGMGNKEKKGGEGLFWLILKGGERVQNTKCAAGPRRATGGA